MNRRYTRGGRGHTGPWFDRILMGFMFLCVVVICVCVGALIKTFE